MWIVRERKLRQTPSTCSLYPWDRVPSEGRQTVASTRGMYRGMEAICLSREDLRSPANA